MEKTKIEFLIDFHHETLRPYKKGERGYIDGYLRAADGRPCMVIVVGELIDLIPFTNVVKAINS